MTTQDIINILTEKTCIAVLVGLPASGKSTFARKCAAAGMITVCGDAIVEAVHGGDYTQYNPELKPLYKRLQYGIIEEALELGRGVVIDKTSITAASRRQWITWAFSRRVPAYAIVFPIACVDEHLRRRMENSRGYSEEKWREVVERQMREREPVMKEEGFADVYYVDDEPQWMGICHYCYKDVHSNQQYEMSAMMYENSEELRLPHEIIFHKGCKPEYVQRETQGE